jgi:hypothetical protein
MMNDTQFEKMMTKLDLLIKITASNIFKDKPLNDSIVFLIKLGFGNTDIAEILGTTYSYVANVRTDSKKEKRKRKKSKNKESKEQPIKN